MKIRFEERTYPGNNARPSVNVQSFENERLYCFSVPWGTQDAVELLSENIRANFLSYMNEEATMVGNPHSLLRQTQALKTILKNVNNEIFKVHNEKFYSTACETILLHMDEQHVSWIQIGQPFVLLLRNEKVQILQAARDLSLDYSMKTALPAELLGVHAQLDFNPQHLLTKAGDVLIFFNSTHLPLTFQSVNNVETLFDSLAQKNPNLPFWLGLLYIE